MPDLSPDTRLRLARFLASDALALRIAANNSNAGSIDIHTAVETDSCFAIRLKRSIVCFDIDKPAAQSSVAELVRAAELAGLPYLLVESSPGRSHVFLAAEGVSPDLLALLRFVGRSLGFDVRRAVRPPGTRHRSLASRSKIAGGDLSAMMATVDEQTFAVRSFLAALDIPTLTPRLSRARLRGHNAAGFESSSEFRSALAVWVVSQGYDSLVLRDLLAASDLGPRWTTRSDRWKTAELTRLMVKARSWVETVDAKSRWEVMSRYSWTGHEGMSDRAVLEALVRYAGVARDVAMPVAEIAVKAGATYQTTRKALDRLESSGLLEVVEAPSATTATVWRPTPEVPASVTPTERSPKLITGVAIDLGADHVVAGKAGRASMLVWRALKDKEGRSVADLCHELGVQPSAMRGRLGRLRDADLAVRTDSGWRRLHPTDEDIKNMSHSPGRRARRLSELREAQSRRRLERQMVARNAAAESTGPAA